MKRILSVQTFYLIFIPLFFLFSACTVVNQNDGTIIFTTHAVNNKENVSAFDEEFDPDEFVESVWESRAVPVFKEKAVDLHIIKSAIDEDFNIACDQYGTISNDKSGWIFVIKGTGKLLEVNRVSRNGTLLVEVDAGVNTWTLQIQIGPVYKGMVLRDALPFISFNDYQNQIIFSGISSAFNRKIDRDVIIPSAIDDTWVGKNIQFIGALSLRNGQSDWIITPVMLALAKE
jgi:predicted lipoprotein